MAGTHGYEYGGGFPVEAAEPGMAPETFDRRFLPGGRAPAGLRRRVPQVMEPVGAFLLWSSRSPGR